MGALSKETPGNNPEESSNRKLTPLWNWKRREECGDALRQPRISKHVGRLILAPSLIFATMLSVSGHTFLARTRLLHLTRCRAQCNLIALKHGPTPIPHDGAVL
jgi:hypothetical protein